MILAAGRGERMRPLTDHCPKPLLLVRGKALIDWHIEALMLGGFNDVVINTAWLGEQFAPHFSAQHDRQIRLQPDDLGREQLSISYSHEGIDFSGALETAGGIARALPLLGQVFWVLAGDVYTPGFEFTQAAVERFTASGKLAHLWLVHNPPHHLTGDFGIDADGRALNVLADTAQPRYTFSTIALYRKSFFDGLPFGNPEGIKAALAPMLRAAMHKRQISAELYPGLWTDVGTPQRLAQLNLN